MITIITRKTTALIKINNLYDKAMRQLQSRYPQSEINTFARKSTAAKSYTADASACDNNDKYLLAKIDGVVNGAVPLSAAEIATELAGVSAAGWATVLERATKILDAEHAYDFYLAKIEQVRNAHLAQLVDGEDNSAVVASLSAAYALLEG